MDWICLRSPIPVRGGFRLRFPGTRRNEVARQAYHMLIDCQNESPHKSLRIRALRSAAQSERGTGTGNNFHSVRSAYPIPRLVSSFRSLFAISHQISDKFAKITE